MLRKLLKIAGAIVVVILVGAVAVTAWILTHWDVDYSSVPKPAIAASADPDVIRRGEYLFHSAGHCSACHTGPDVRARKSGDRSAPVGGTVFEAGPFGRFVSRNLTSDRETGIGALTDGDIARVIRHGVGADGKYLPLMALSLGPMADEDVAALISYLRTMPPVKRQEAPEAWGFLAKALAPRFKPHDEPPPVYVAAGPEPSVARGAYLANGPAGCVVCHSRRDPFHGFVRVGEAFSGGDPDPDESDPTYEMVPPNLTPDPVMGHISGWSEDTFVQRFQAGPIFKGTRMPWENFAELTESDVRSLYRYLRSLSPVAHNNGPTRRPAGWKPPAATR